MVKAMFSALIAMLSTTGVVQSSSDPFGFDHRGKFFYSQVFFDPSDSVHYHVEVGLGCDNFKQNWTITALEESVGYVTEICTAARLCEVPRKFPWGIDQTNPSDACITDFNQNLIHEQAFLNDGQDSAFLDPIPYYILQGYSATNTIKFTNPAYGREMDVQMRSFAIMQSNTKTFTSPYYSGYLGFGPYSSDSEIRDENIIYHLKHNNIIDHAIVSLYLQPTGTSLIKFGGYDKAALYDPADFDVFKTISKNSWTIKATEPYVNNKTFQTDSSRHIEFQIEPQLAMIYMPSDDYSQFKEHVKDIFGNVVDCDQQDRPCIFSTKCADIPDDDIPFQMTIQDDNTKRNLTIGRSNLLLDGGVTGLEDTCFVGVYKLQNTSAQNNTYYFGSPFFHEYYVSFSLESWERNFGDYLQVGIGPICKTAYLGDVVYNQNYEHYNPNLAANDTSKSTGASINFRDDLENTCIHFDLDDEEGLGSKQSGTMLAIALSVGGFALVLTILIVSVYCYRKAQQKTKSFASVADGKQFLDFTGSRNIQGGTTTDDSFNSSKMSGASGANNV